MKLCCLFLLILFSLSATAQETSKPDPKLKARPIDNTKEEQEAMDKNTVNEYDVGPYNHEGKYLYYSRLLEEMKAAKEGRTMETE